MFTIFLKTVRQNLTRIKINEILYIKTNVKAEKEVQINNYGRVENNWWGGGVEESKIIYLIATKRVAHLHTENYVKKL